MNGKLVSSQWRVLESNFWQKRLRNSQTTKRAITGKTALDCGSFSAMPTGLAALCASKD